LAKRKETIIDMIDALKSMLGMGPSVDYNELMAKGAQIIDVRTPGEYAGGHIKGSKNIPLQSLSSNLGKINKNKPVITCCASGMRSASAKSVLQSNGFTDVHNGGGWASLNAKLK
jgi:phage shock protein E